MIVERHHSLRCRWFRWLFKLNAIPVELIVESLNESLSKYLMRPESLGSFDALKNENRLGSQDQRLDSSPISVLVFFSQNGFPSKQIMQISEKFK